MAKHSKPEEIVAKLRQAELLISQDQSVAEAIRAIGVSEVTYGRTPQRRDLLHTSGGTGRDRKLARSRQHHQTARLAWATDLQLPRCSCQPSLGRPRQSS